MSGVLFEQAVSSIDAIIHDGDNLSDHEPVTMNLRLVSKYVSLSTKIHLDKIAWHKANDSHLSEYRNVLNDALTGITVPASAIACGNPLCGNTQHSIDLNTYANLIADACIESAKVTIPYIGWTGKRSVQAELSQLNLRVRSLFSGTKYGLSAIVQRRAMKLI
jgi:hypothetical protein